MKCVICKNGETVKGHSLVTLSRDNSIIVFKNVPAEICSNCGEKYFSQEITKELLKTAEAAKNNGVEIDVRDYKAT